MKHILLFGLLFFFPTVKTFDTTLDEVEFEKLATKLTSAKGLHLPDMKVKFDIFVADNSILYEMPKFYLNDQEVKCNNCGECPVMVEYREDHIEAFCLRHAPMRVTADLYKPEKRSDKICIPDMPESPEISC